MKRQALKAPPQASTRRNYSGLVKRRCIIPSTRLSLHTSKQSTISLKLNINLMLEAHIFLGMSHYENLKKAYNIAIA